MGSAGTADSVDPATGVKFLPPYGMDDGTAASEACRKAAAAFDTYRALPTERRAEFLRAVASELEAAGEQIVELYAEETALGEARARNELARTTGQLRMFADLLDDPSWPEVRRVDGLVSRRVPLGPVAVFGASNFPLAFSVAGGDTASALAAGCPVVVKGHPAHLRVSELAGACVAAAAAATGMPDGVFSLVFGAGNDIGQQLAADPRIAAIGFTGSRAGGTALMGTAQRRAVPIPVYAEMSSINPVFLLPGRLEAGAAEVAAGFAGSLTMGAGQFCTNPGLLLAVEGAGLAEFRRALVPALGGQAGQTMLTERIATAYGEGVARLGSIPGTGRIAVGGEGPNPPAVYEADVETFLKHEELHEEVFGAAGLLVVCPSAEDLVRAAEHLGGQLTATLQAAPGDRDLALALLPVLERKAGRIVYNGWPTGVAVTAATVHGGPYPATSDGRSTSVGTMAVERFLRAVCYQDFPGGLLPNLGT
ncbi:aldehyde dehydrogenase (NADP(+)) [Actinoplanes sp. LDG1-06]|uniref:Aldehyde dehydrogenase (NADP(+)) n=2 Tax=Paractinoplanes ovalisporus TaxID=2810368 RepID=A0ABS2A4V3_9ACTN|nr:aldehyde dehydrogenase (NADP(+)) [Actinoplanes ovalisporus]